MPEKVLAAEPDGKVSEVGTTTRKAEAPKAEIEPTPYMRPSERRRVAAGLPPRPITISPAASMVPAPSSDGGLQQSAVTVTGDPHIYLTFDDGPHYGTDDCLDVLDAHGITATFFVCGWNFRADQGATKVAWNKQISRRIAEKHVMANHSHSHRHKKYPDTEWFVRDMEQNVEEFAQVHETLPPGLESMSRLPTVNTWRLAPNHPRNMTCPTMKGNGAVADRLIADGILVFGWDIEWHFKSGRGGRIPKQSPQEMYDRIEKIRTTPNQLRIQNHIVLLMHDNMFRKSADTKDDLGTLIELLAAGGYKFATMDQYPVNGDSAAGGLESSERMVVRK